MNEIELLEPRALAIRSYDWTPEVIRWAEMSADNGDIALAADLCEFMHADDRVMGVLETRADTLFGAPLSFVDGARRAIAALDVAGDWWQIASESALKSLVRWAWTLGFGLAELSWRRTESGRLVPRLHVKNPRWLEFDWQTRAWKLWVGDFGPQGAPRRQIEVTPGDGRWVFYAPFGDTRPWVHGAYRALARWVLLKRYALSDWGFYSNRHGNGIMLAKVPPGTPEHERKKLVADLRGLGRNSGLVVPQGADLSILEATANTWQTFAEQIRTADNGIAVTILGQNLSTQASAGTGAVADLHGAVALGRTRADNEALATCLHDQVLVPYMRANYPRANARTAPWPWWDTTTASERMQDASHAQQRAQAAATLKGAGANIDLDALAAEMGFPVAPPPEPAAPAVDTLDRAIRLSQAGARVDLTALAKDEGMPVAEEEQPDEVAQQLSDLKDLAPIVAALNAQGANIDASAVAEEFGLPTRQESPEERLGRAKTLVDLGAKVDAEALALELGVPTAEGSAKSGQIYKYHFDYGVLTKNEAREALGLGPLAEGGDEAPRPVVAQAPESDADPA